MGSFDDAAFIDHALEHLEINEVHRETCSINKNNTFPIIHYYRMIGGPNLGLMSRKPSEPSPTLAVTVGMLALASAMGIGRFSLTPILPIMQTDMGLTLAQGGWLATGNYLGYLAGALICMAFAARPADAIRWGLVCVGVSTLAMGFGRSPLLWLVLRFFAGVASAFVLVGVSAWAMPILARCRRESWSGRIFAGVGIGIVFAGLLGLAAGIGEWGARSTWIVMGVVATALAILLWRPLATNVAAKAVVAAKTGGLPRRALIAAACYGLFGYGYIIPATFLPALARRYIDDPLVFGWVWPVFGASAAISTLLAARFGHRLPSWRLWTGAQWVLTAGVLAPVVSLNVATLLMAAVCVGGTFMIITMAGIREVMRVGGPQASRGVGMMTAAFALGQIAGPMTVSLLAGSSNAFTIASMIAALALVIGNGVLSIDNLHGRYDG
jgi:predicted MFS family arabinose efflux permease